METYLLRCLAITIFVQNANVAKYTEIYNHVYSALLAKLSKSGYTFQDVHLIFEGIGAYIHFVDLVLIFKIDHLKLLNNNKCILNLTNIF